MPSPGRVSLFLIPLFVVSLAGISACDLLTEAEDGDACWITWQGSDAVLSCSEVESAQECDQQLAEIEEAMQTNFDATYDVGGAACSTPPDAPGDGDSDVPGGCGSEDYSSSYGAGEEQVDLMCQAAWGYRCAGADAEADATCQSIEDYAGSSADCPYC